MLLHHVSNKHSHLNIPEETLGAGAAGMSCVESLATPRKVQGHSDRTLPKLVVAWKLHTQSTHTSIVLITSTTASIQGASPPVLQYVQNVRTTRLSTNQSRLGREPGKDYWGNIFPTDVIDTLVTIQKCCRTFSNLLYYADTSQVSRNSDELSRLLVTFSQHLALFPSTSC
jgi:hypothetical protein